MEILVELNGAELGTLLAPLKLGHRAIIRKAVQEVKIIMNLHTIMSMNVLPIYALDQCPFSSHHNVIFIVCTEPS